VDSGVFNAVQHAAITALRGPQDCVKNACAIYQERRNVLIAGLQDLGFDVPPPKATFYVWLPVDDCMAFTKKLLTGAGIVAAPGVGFGSSGEGYVRFALTRPVERIKEAIGRMQGLDL
jgi:LL-diaminopimelate aminotransferase